MSSPSAPPFESTTTTEKTAGPPNAAIEHDVSDASFRTKKSTQALCEQICATDVDENAEGIATGVRGIQWEALSVKNLRTVCARLGFKGYKNANKVGIIDIIVRCCKAKKVYETLWDSEAKSKNNDTKSKNNTQTTTSTRKETQCVFRLINVLFSDAFAGQFISIGDVANRQVLDSRKAANDEFFWEQVQKAFVTKSPGLIEYDRLHFADDEVFCDREIVINPSVIVNHSWKKLRSMWKTVNADYKAALTRFTLSGTHNSNFFSFCNGKLETYYLRLNLDRRPELNGMVEADLPFACFLASEMSTSDVGERVLRANWNKSSSSSSGKDIVEDCIENGIKRQKVKHERGQKGDVSSDRIAVAIRDYGNSQMKAEVAKQRLLFMQEEGERRCGKTLLQTWEMVCGNIRLLRNDLRNLDETEVSARAEILEDIEGLNERKNELARELGIRKK
jgi:hypothetical protein